MHSALSGAAGWLLILLSIGVLTVGLERLRFWVIWWKRRRTLHQQWQEVLHLGERRARAWINDRDMDMRFAQAFLEASIVIAPLLGLIGTVLGLSRLLSAMGPRLLLPEGGGDQGFGEILLMTAMGLVVSLVATVTWHLSNTFRQWQLALWQRDLHQREPSLPSG
ncbi:MAG: MotA/TolQ/ExbB proton channel family protein [Cyanobacteriota bacterium]|nr:MotA/TolQ/ExbB proton channel family protein [Cyanobacteriota bacterium]